MTENFSHSSSQIDETLSEDDVKFSDDRLNDLLNESSFLFKLLVTVGLFLLAVALIHMGWAMALRITKYLYP